VHLLLFELLDRQLPVVDRNKRHQFAVLFNVHVCLLNLCLETDHVLLLAHLRLEETLQGCLSKRELLQLLLIVASFGFGIDLLLHDFLTTLDRINHALDVQHFALDPESSLSKRRLVALNRIVELGGHVSGIRVGEDSLVSLIVAEELNSNIFVGEELLIDRSVVVVTLRVLLGRIVKHQSIFL